MANQSNNRGCAGWFKWMVGTLITLIGLGGGIAAWVSLFDKPDPAPAATPYVVVVSQDLGPPASENTQPAPDTVPVSTVVAATAVPTPVPIQAETQLTPRMAQDVELFLQEAVVAESAAYLFLDSSLAAPYYAGNAFATLQSNINELTVEGIVAANLFDAASSAIVDMRLVNDNRIDVDSCEVWSTEYYNLWDNSFLGSEPAHLVPQTITIEQFIEGWFITDVTFYEAPAFCP